MGIGIYTPFAMYGEYAAIYGMPIPSINNLTEQARFLILQKFINIFCERFKYKNLPEETKQLCGNNNILELMLFFAPSVAWFKDEVLGLQCLPTTGEYNYTITGMPTTWRVKGANGYERELNETNSVLMFNDNAYSIPFLHVMYEANFMVENDMTHKQELLSHRTPLIMEMEEDEKKSANKFINQLDNFKDVIKVRLREKDNKNVKQNPYNTQAFRATDTEYNGKLYMDDYKEFENRVLTYFGINNVNIEKKERLLTGEISSNDMIIQLYYSAALNSRKESIEKVNKMFGYNISVVENKLFSLIAKNLNTQVMAMKGGDSNVRTNETNEQDAS